jgi:ABC-type transport system involved in cytochrome bd biosynthesis fused ATPase/permease subunit
MTVMVTVALVLALVAGCITVRTPEGTSTTRVDLDTTIAIAQLSFNLAQQGFELWAQYQELNVERDEVAYQAELLRRQQQLEALKGALQELYRLRGGDTATPPDTP